MRNDTFNVERKEPSTPECYNQKIPKNIAKEKSFSDKLKLKNLSL